MTSSSPGRPPQISLPFSRTEEDVLEVSLLKDSCLEEGTELLIEDLICHIARS
jgi:hypothetical protein